MEAVGTPTPDLTPSAACPNMAGKALCDVCGVMPPEYCGQLPLDLKSPVTEPETKKSVKKDTK